MAHHDMKDFAASVVTLEAEAEAMEKIMDMYAAKIEKIIEAGALREWEGAIEEVLDFSHDPFDLSRFVEAQSARRSGYATALTEIKAGRKQSHWIWYVYPQLRDLIASASRMAQMYGITSIEETKAYLKHPILRPRLLEITTAALESETLDAHELMGSVVDKFKLQSSMTLFARTVGAADSLFYRVLDKYYESVECSLTLKKLGMTGMPRDSSEVMLQKRCGKEFTEDFLHDLDGLPMLSKAPGEVFSEYEDRFSVILEHILARKPVWSIATVEIIRAGFKLSFLKRARVQLWTAKDSGGEEGEEEEDSD